MSCVKFVLIIHYKNKNLLESSDQFHSIPKSPGITGSNGFIHLVFFPLSIIKSISRKKTHDFLDCGMLLKGFKKNFLESCIILSEARTHWESLKALRTRLSRGLLLEATSGSRWAGEGLWMHCSSPSSRGISTSFSSFSRICSCQTSSTTDGERTRPLTIHPLLS